MKPRAPWWRWVLRRLGRIIGTERWELYHAAVCRCVNCGRPCIVMMKVGGNHPYYNQETGLVDMLECCECGKLTICSE